MSDTNKKASSTRLVLYLFMLADLRMINIFNYIFRMISILKLKSNQKKIEKWQRTSMYQRRPSSWFAFFILYQLLLEKRSKSMM